MAKRKIADRLRRNPAQSVRKISREIKIPKTTAQDIVRRDLKLKERKKEKKQALVSPQKAKRERQDQEFFVEVWTATRTDEFCFAMKNFS